MYLRLHSKCMQLRRTSMLRSTRTSQVLHETGRVTGSSSDWRTSMATTQNIQTVTVPDPVPYLHACYVSSCQCPANTAAEQHACGSPEAAACPIEPARACLSGHDKKAHVASAQHCTIHCPHQAYVLHHRHTGSATSLQPRADAAPASSPHPVDRMMLAHVCSTGSVSISIH